MCFDGEYGNFLIKFLKMFEKLVKFGLGYGCY